MTELEVDQDRTIALIDQAIYPTEIFVRAKDNGSWVNADIATLSKESLIRWLREKQKTNPDFSLQCVVLILGHVNKEK